VNSIMFILSICSIPLTLCFVFVFILFSVLPYGEIKLCKIPMQDGGRPPYSKMLEML